MSSSLEVAARLAWITAPGPELDQETRRLLLLGAGGLILFEQNIRSPEQVAQLCREARAAASGPLRIAVDQEGGHILRLAEPLTRMPSAMAIGATRSAELAYLVGRASARELSALGIDTVLAPVLDLAVEPGSKVVGARAFGSDAALVGSLAAHMIRGYHAGGVVCVAKHFPGHGRTEMDSHLATPVIAGGERRLQTEDLPPFREAVKAGVDGIMVGHCVYPEIDSAPASLSRAIAGRLTRERLGFGGVLISDALVMDAITNRYGIPAAATLALSAGIDMVMPLAKQEAAIRAMALAIDAGVVSERRIGASLRRLERLDARAAKLRRARTNSPEFGHDAEEHSALASRVAQEAVTAVDAPPIVLNAAAPVSVLELASGRPSPIEDGHASHRAYESLAGILPAAEFREIAPRDLSAARTGMLRAGCPVVLITRDNASAVGFRGFVASACERGPVVHVAMRSPHDLSYSAGLGAARIAAYSDTPATLVAVIEKLAGKGEWHGRLPVPPSWTAYDPAVVADVDAAA